jgi:hypothetical protein
MKSFIVLVAVVRLYGATLGLLAFCRGVLHTPSRCIAPPCVGPKCDAPKYDAPRYDAPKYDGLKPVVIHGQHLRCYFGAAVRCFRSA